LLQGREPSLVNPADFPTGIGPQNYRIRGRHALRHALCDASKQNGRNLNDEF
jgi:hypothetical protein